PHAEEPPKEASRSMNALPSFETGAARPPQDEGGQQRRREKRDVHGWIVLDKPVGMTSTHAVSVIKRLFTAKRAGHAGTLDPLEARPVEIHDFALVEMPDVDHAVFEAECGKGTYVRALARDMGRVLGCLGHVSALRRTRVGSFDENDMISLAELERLCQKAAA